jgi:hypothetical protein
MVTEADSLGEVARDGGGSTPASSEPAAADGLDVSLDKGRAGGFRACWLEIVHYAVISFR